MIDCFENWEHPDDIQGRLDSEALAIKQIDAFVAKHNDVLAALIQTYSDEKAVNLLHELREQFWSNLSGDDEQ